MLIQPRLLFFLHGTGKPLRCEQTMPHKETSSSAALETSVALLRGGIGPAASNAFALAPLWVPNVGCIGLIAIADIPYARNPSTASGRGGRSRKADKYGGSDSRNKTAGHRHGQRHGGGGNLDEATAGGRVGRKKCARYAVGVGLVEFVRRVGVTLGTTTYRLRKQSLVTRIKAEGNKFSIYGQKQKNEERIVNTQLRLGSSTSPQPLSPPLADRYKGGGAGSRR